MAVALLEARGFTADDFALSHPGGSLGKRLLLTLKDVMHSGKNTPIINVTQTIKDALIEMSAKGLGMTAIVDSQQQLVGLFTDGDLRRTLDARLDINETPIGQLIGSSVKTIDPDMLAAAALHIMEENEISSLVVLDDAGALTGVVHLKDLLHAGIV